jgi:rhodanese-related sulfurtransferase
MKTKVFLLLSCILLFSAFVEAGQQVQFVNAEQVKAWVDGRQKKFVLIDARLPEEYGEAHIPRAVNIPAGQMMLQKARLPKDKSAPLIFYCRGVG